MKMKIKSIFKKGNTYFLKHGMSTTRFYKIWKNMRYRCLRETAPNYRNYGARGISVDKNWSNFINFKNDMLKKYNKHVELFGEKNTQIDRINNNKNYYKENCCWSTRKEQNRNKRTNRWIIYKNETKTIAEWAELINIDYDALQRRTNKNIIKKLKQLLP